MAGHGPVNEMWAGHGRVMCTFHNLFVQFLSRLLAAAPPIVASSRGVAVAPPVSARVFASPWLRSRLHGLASSPHLSQPRSARTMKTIT